MRDGLLHAGPIHGDVATFEAGPGCTARGCGGGWPCQATRPSVWRMLHEMGGRAAQGISRAGRQAGLKDHRSNLLKHIFRIYDSLNASRSLSVFSRVSRRSL